MRVPTFFYAFVFLIVLCIESVSIAATSQQETVEEETSEQHWEGRSYLDLTEPEKKQITFIKKKRKHCFIDEIRKKDNGTVDPFELSRLIQNKCDASIEEMKKLLTKKLKMGEHHIEIILAKFRQEYNRHILIDLILKERQRHRDAKEKRFRVK